MAKQSSPAIYLFLQMALHGTDHVKGLQKLLQLTVVAVSKWLSLVASVFNLLNWLKPLTSGLLFSVQFVMESNKIFPQPFQSNADCCA